MTQQHQNTRTLFVEDIAIDRGDKPVLEHVSFSLAPGALLWVIGDNGIGKTSLLKCIAGFIKPRTGRVLWGDENLHDTPAGSIAYQGHIDANKPMLSVAENLKFWHKLYASTGDITDAIERVGLSEQTRLAAGRLSAGQSRRLSLARLYLKRAPLWILDEPTAAMDERGRDIIKTLMTHHLDNQGSVILASHTKPIRMGKNTRVLSLNQGR